MADASSWTLRERYGPAGQSGPSSGARPPRISEDTVAALGKLSEALEVVEHARGLLYGFHRLCGTADLTLQNAVALLRGTGHGALADELDEVLVGRDVVGGMWSYQLVESYDAGYWHVFRDAEAYTRNRIAPDAERHRLEADMKRREQAIRER